MKSKSINDQLGNIQKPIDDMVGGIVNPILKIGNDAIRGFAAADVFETDPTSLAELFTESFKLIQNVVIVSQMTLKKLVGLDNNVQKNLIKLSEEGDNLCNNVGGVKMTVSLPNLTPPYGYTRWFDACLEAKTAEMVIQEAAKNPIGPITKFMDCAISETLLKPLDNAIVDVKNSVSNAVKTVTNLGDVQNNIKNGAQSITDGLEKFFAGTYTMSINPDALTCFQKRMNGMDYKTTNFERILKNLADMNFVAGKKIEPVPLSNKSERSFCSI